MHLSRFSLQQHDNTLLATYGYVVGGGSSFGQVHTSVALADTHYLGNKEYELTNHLGNVLTTISDRKLQNFYSTANTVNPTVVSFYSPDLLSTKDYYAFG